MGDMSDGARRRRASSSSSGSGSGSGSDDERCSICLERLRGRELGAPACCAHAFCLECLLEWARTAGTCPVDRRPFDSVAALSGGPGSRPVRLLPAPNLTPVDVEDSTRCERCARQDGEDTMLLCDACDLAYHMHCLQPPLTEVPSVTETAHSAPTRTPLTLPTLCCRSLKASGSVRGVHKLPATLRELNTRPARRRKRRGRAATGSGRSLQWFRWCRQSLPPRMGDEVAVRSRQLVEGSTRDGNGPPGACWWSLRLERGASSPSPRKCLSRERPGGERYVLERACFGLQMGPTRVCCL